MADYYLDKSAIGNEYQAWASTPTWGALSTDKPLPMDGNGKAGPGHSAAVAIAEIQITVLPADGNTLVIAGATVTAKTAAAAKNQWTISGSIATCVSNLVALLNTSGTGVAQCDAAVSSSASALTLALPFWQFARVKPGATDTLQIATRIAGSTLNQATNGAVAISSSGWGTPPTLTQFAGGADGPFAYELNTATVFGKSDGQTGTAGPAYGLFFAVSSAPTDPTTADVIHVRTRRSGSDLSTTWSTTGTASATWRSRNYLFDNGTVWSGDNGKLTVTFKNTNGSSVASSFALGAGSLALNSRSKGNFEIQVAVTTSGTGSFIIASMTNGGRLSYKQSRFVEASDNIRTVSMCSDGGLTAAAVFIDMSDAFVQFRTTAKKLVSMTGSGTGLRVTLNGMVVEVVSASSAIGAILDATGAAMSGIIEWIGGEVRDSLAGYRCTMPFNINVGVPIDSLIDGVVGVTDPSVGMTASATTRARLRWNSPEGPNKGFRSESPQYVVDWKGDGTFPYAGAAADLRGVNWSHRITWTAIPTAWAAITPLVLKRFYRSASATAAVTVELYVPNATTMYDDELELTVSYLDSSDVWQNESVGGVRALQFSGTRSALAASGVTWTANGVAAHSAKKITLTTANPIKEGSEITARLSLCTSRSPTVTFYASPELGVA